MISEAQFNRGTLDCMTALRRKLKQDLGIVIRLADADAVEQMLRISQQSEAGDIRELGLRLLGLLAPPPTSEPAMLAQGAIASRRYTERVSPASDLDQPVAAAPSPSVRIYRGQIIRG